MYKPRVKIPAGRLNALKYIINSVVSALFLVFSEFYVDKLSKYLETLSGNVYMRQILQLFGLFRSYRQKYCF